MNKQKLLVLGGKPVGSVDIVNYAKSIGCYVIVADYLDVKDSPAKQIADECWNVSTADLDTLAKKAKLARIDGVFTGAHDFNIDKAQKHMSADKKIAPNKFKQIRTVEDVAQTIAELLE